MIEFFEMYFVVFLIGMAAGGALVAFYPREREAVWVAKDGSETLSMDNWQLVKLSGGMPFDTKDAGDIGRGSVPDFNVTGKPRRAPWNQRRKELEAAARTKRKQIEQFRSIENG